MTTLIPYSLVTEAEYCAGDIRKTYREAKAAAVIDPQFQQNVEDLEKLLPETITLDQIVIRLGVQWLPMVPVDDQWRRCPLLEDFAEDVLGVNGVTVKLNRFVNIWEVDASFTQSTANLETYGVHWVHPMARKADETKWVTGLELMAMALNLKQPYIKRKMAIGTYPAYDPVLTTEARRKQEELHQEFSDWIKCDPIRAQTVETLYNNLFNSMRLPVYDGSHLSLHGMSQEWRDRLRQPERRYQLDGAWRAATSPYNMAAWWEVGTGKSALAILSAMLCKQIGKAKKPMLVVQKSTLANFARLVHSMYPTGKFLVATKDDCNKQRRPAFMSAIACNNWDLVVVTHQQYERMRMRPEFQIQQIEAKVDQIEATLAKFNCDERSTRAVKAIIKLKNRLLERVQRLQNQISPGELFFEDLGIDWVCYDEAHKVKRCQFWTKLNGVLGIPTGHSNIGEDFRNKRDYLHQMYGEGRILKMTGTPISTTAAEAFIELWDLCPSVMQERMLEEFDACVSQFGKVSQTVEFKPTGKLELTNRLSNFKNVISLKMLIFSVADVRTADEVGIVRPRKREIKVLAPMSPEQREYMDYVVERAERIKLKCPMKWDRLDKKGNPVMKMNDMGELVVEKIYDCNLLVSTDARKACLHIWMHDRSKPDFFKSKLYKACRRIANIYRRSQTGMVAKRDTFRFDPATQTRTQVGWAGDTILVERATQVVFCDLGVPNNRQFSVHEFMRDILIHDYNIPAEEIAFDHDCKNDEDIGDLDDAMNSGQVRILFTSTEKGGIGRNFHERLAAPHLIDPTWGSIYDEQRIGRGWRYGNLHKTVRVYRYLTQGVTGNVGFDPFMLEKCQTKKNMAYRLLNKDMSCNEFEEDSALNPSFDYAVLKALATGDERVVDYVQAQADLEEAKLNLLSAEKEVNDIKRGRLRDANNRIKDAESTLSSYAGFFEVTVANAHILQPGNYLVDFSPVMNNPTTNQVQDPKLAAQYLAEIRKLISQEAKYDTDLLVGYYGGLGIVLHAVKNQNCTVQLQAPSGKLYPHRVYAPTITSNHEKFDGLEYLYNRLLQLRQGALNTIARQETKVTELKATLKQKEALRHEMSARLSEVELRKSKLEADLGISDTSNEEIIEVDDEE